jgi:hypothetical protein
MTVQSIKLKSSEALKIIEDYAWAGNPRKDPLIKGNLFDIQENTEEQNSDYHEPDDTQYMSFDDYSRGPPNGLPNKLNRK